MKLLLPAVFVCTLMGQTVIPNGAPASYSFDGRVDEWKDLAPTLQLRPSVSGGRKASVWVRQVPEGLLVAGQAEGAAPDFAATAEDMLRKDHVEIWIAPEKPQALPPIGWSNVEGENLPANVNECVTLVTRVAPQGDYYQTTPLDDCREWFGGVTAYRRRFARLFARQYGLSPELVVEAYATPAWEELGGEQRFDSSGTLDPAGNPRFPSGMIPPPVKPPPAARPIFKAAPSDGGYSFEALLPWDSLPPLGSLKLKSMRLMVDVFSAHKGAAKDQPFSTSSPVRQYGKLETLNLVTLAAGREYRITDCQFPLEGWGMDNRRETALFRPHLDLNVTDVIVLANGGATKAYRPEGHSPTWQTVGYLQRQLGANVTACGSSDPEAARFGWRDQAGIRRFHRQADLNDLEAKAQADGTYLVKWGPLLRRRSASEQTDPSNPCFDCEDADLHILLLGVHGDPKSLFDFHERAGATDTYTPGGIDMDVHLSPDWNTAVIYRERETVEDSVTTAAPPRWTSESFCRQALAYKPCGKNPKSEEPSPRVLKPHMHD